MGALYSKCEDMEKARLAKPPTCDIYRDSPLRLLGYAGHVGVCSGLLSPKAVLTGQMITTAYIFGDVFQKSAYSSNKFEPRNTTIKKSFDAFLWQLLASVIIPGFIVNRTRCYTRSLLRQTAKGGCGPSPKRMNLIPCIISMLILPVISRPIDNCVNYIMDNTYRDWSKDTVKAVPKKGL